MKDLCGRLPYNTVIEVIDNRGKEEIRYTTIISCAEVDMFQHDEKMIKPYLRRLSSMTDEEREELKKLTNCDYVAYDSLDYTVGGQVDYDDFLVYYDESSKLIDWLNKNMFDYRGLIPKDLALELPEGIYKKTSKE